MHSRTNDIVIRGPKIHINGIENTQEGETPGYSVDNDPFSFRGELVENRGQQEEVNQRPEWVGSMARRLGEGKYTNQMRNAHAEGVM